MPSELGQVLREDQSETTWRPDPSIISAQFGEEAALFHLRTGRLFTLPPLAAHVWHMLALGYGQIEIAAGFPRQYYGDVEELVADVTNIFEMLEKEGLIQLNAEGLEEFSDVVEGEQESTEELESGSILIRAPQVSIHLDASTPPAIEFESNSGHVNVVGNDHVLRLIDAFDQPRSVREVIRALQVRVSSVEEWSNLVSLLFDLYQADVLRKIENLETDSSLEETYVSG